VKSLEEDSPHTTSCGRSADSNGSHPPRSNYLPEQYHCKP